MHAPSQRNITYVQMVRWSIYESIQPEPPLSPIHRYQPRPQGPPSRLHYMESFPFHRYATSTSTSTVPEYSSPLQLNHRVMRTPIATSDPPPWAVSLASKVFLVTIFDPIWLTIIDLIRLNYCFDLIRMNYFSIQLNSPLTYSFLIWVTQFKSYSRQSSGSPTLARVSSK